MLTARMEGQKHNAVAHCPFPVYGLDHTWTGRRWFGGFVGLEDSVSQLTLSHGDVDDPGAPRARVSTRSTTEAKPNRGMNRSESRGKRFMVHSLVRHLWNETGVYPGGKPSTFQSEDPTGRWGKISLRVDGESTEFSSLQVGATWIALGEVGDALVGLEARNFDPAEIGLVRIANPMVYLQDDGRRR